MYGQNALLFNKDYPGAELTFQPDDIADYSGDAWDIRVTIADMPLDEGFYIEVSDPNAVNETIESLLKKYVLNIERRDELDVENYPDLPYIQDELIQYFENSKQGTLTLEVYVNKNPAAGPVALYQRASKFLSTCYYDDGSEDYLLLDLVIVPSVPEQSSYDKSSMKRRFSEIFLLQLFDFHASKGDTPFAEFCRQAPIAYFLGASVSNANSEIYTELNNLHRKGYITRDMAPQPDPQTGARYTTGLTDPAREQLNAWQTTLMTIRTDYDCFSSVSVAPPSLGVPGGFDARVQMMEYNGMECEQSVLLCVIDESRDEFFDSDHWLETYESGTFFKVVNDAMAYKTNFLPDILDALKSLADEDVVD